MRGTAEHVCTLSNRIMRFRKKLMQYKVSVKSYIHTSLYERRMCVCACVCVFPRLCFSFPRWWLSPVFLPSLLRRSYFSRRLISPRFLKSQRKCRPPRSRVSVSYIHTSSTWIFLRGLILFTFPPSSFFSSPQRQIFFGCGGSQNKIFSNGVS